MMQLIEEFISRYIREYDFYSQAARLAAETLESNLHRSGIRCIVTHRAKDISRLAEKCEKRNAEDPYKEIQDIYSDIVDLAGVRVALYFPGDRERVDRIINRFFHLLEERRDFPDPGKANPSKKFSGYSAAHYRAQLSERSLGDSDKRYAKARVEIQVASVLMHSWSEVEHDLIYKPLEGGLSEEELHILDQLNGLVLAGEIALEMLQKAGEVRVASTDRTFLNHYELAAHILAHANKERKSPVEESGLGRVDLLFQLLTDLEFNTPNSLAPFISSLHENLEERPLADQVIDAIISEDPERYRRFEEIQFQMSFSSMTPPSSDQPTISEEIVGRFWSKWTVLEKTLRGLAVVDPEDTRFMGVGALINRIPNLTEPLKRELDYLRRIRNDLVHSGEIPGAAFLQEAIERIVAVTARLSQLNEPPQAG
ncbi:GTP pyrophosphokinase [Streptomyces rubiginosohelvolus]|uniref:GTP pyrophosphokinase n=1 Tax=Streptomyces rubiginosohelvolus TaxID=67362 RepID=UPI0033A7846A